MSQCCARIKTASRRAVKGMKTSWKSILAVTLLLLLPSTVAGEAGGDADLRFNLDTFALMSDDDLTISLNYSQFSSLEEVHTLTLKISDRGGAAGDVLLRTDWMASNDSTLEEVISVTSFWEGGREHTLTLELVDSGGVVLTSLSEHFVVFDKGESLNPRRLVVFGDSLSDQGNVAAFTPYIPSPPYWEGRITNGPVWVEWVGQEFGITMARGVGSLEGTNRAWGGAEAGEGLYQGVVMNAGPQIADYLANHEVADDDLFAIWIGGNNFLHGATVPQSVVDLIIGHVETLAEAGATHIVVSNLPDMDVTPYYNGLSEEEAAETRARTALYNSQLEHDVIAANARLDAVVQFVNISKLFDDVTSNPEYYHITEISDALCEFEGEMCIESPDSVPLSDGHLFFDSVHPTAATHEILGKAIYEAIASDDFDGDGVTLTADACLNTPLGAVVDERGCAEGELDDDADGILNRRDICPDSPISSEDVNESGCTKEEVDSQKFECDDGEYIGPSLVDDGKKDCLDGSDERIIATVQSDPLPATTMAALVFLLISAAIIHRRNNASMYRPKPPQ